MSGVNGRSSAEVTSSVHSRDCCDNHRGRSGFESLTLRAARSAPTCEGSFTAVRGFRAVVGNFKPIQCETHYQICCPCIRAQQRCPNAALAAVGSSVGQGQGNEGHTCRSSSTQASRRCSTCAVSAAGTQGGRYSRVSHALLAGASAPWSARCCGLALGWRLALGCDAELLRSLATARLRTAAQMGIVFDRASWQASNRRLVSFRSQCSEKT